MTDLEQSSYSEPRIGRPRYEFVVDDSETLGGDSGSDVSITSPRKKPQYSQTSYDLSRKLACGASSIMSLIVVLLAALCLAVLIYLFAIMSPSSSRDASASAHTGSTYESGFNMKENWGAYSPYFSSGASYEGLSKQALEGEYTLPKTCTYKQVHVLHRHGDRYPAGGTVEGMSKVADKLQSMESPPRDEFMQWLNNWEYTLGADDLVSTGVGAMFSSGSRFWGTHGRLLFNAANATAWDDSMYRFSNGSAGRKLLLRTGDQQRVQDSARSWAAGFFGQYGHPSSGPHSHYDLLLIPEGIPFNNSLAGYMGCPNAAVHGANTGKARSKIWVDHYLADAAVRLQKALPGYDNMTASDALYVQDLCVFETAAYGTSAFCELFTETEWRGYEYHIDLKFYGDSAYGSHVGPASATSWVRELKARLQGKLITEPGYGVNTTLDGSPKTFPVNQPLYADFSHDSVIAAVVAAFGFSWTKTDLSPLKIQRPRQFIVSRLTPFAARLYVEVLECDEGEFVRVRLNERVLPLGDLHNCPADELGLCPKKDFIKSLTHALEAIDFDDACYTKRDYPAYEP